MLLERDIGGSLNKFPDFFRQGTFIDSTHETQVPFEVIFSSCNTPVHNSIFVTDYLTKMGIKTVPHPPYSPELAPCDFWLFPKLSGCCYGTMEEMKEAVTKVIDTLTQEDFDGAFQELLER